MSLVSPTPPSGNFALSMFSNTAFVPRCSNGLTGFEGENENGKACCPVGCTGCGGLGCGRIGAAQGLGNKDCCINGVLNNRDLCSVSSEAPCVVDGE